MSAPHSDRWKRHTALFSFILPYFMLLFVIGYAGFLIIELKNLERDAQRAAADWNHLHEIMIEKFTFARRSALEEPDRPGYDLDEGIRRVNETVGGLCQQAPSIGMDDATTQVMGNLCRVWRMTRRKIIESNNLYEEIIESRLGAELRNLTHAGLVEASLVGTPGAGFHEPDLWRFYRLQDSLTDIDLSGEVVTAMLSQVQEHISQRAKALTAMIIIIAFLVSVFVTWAAYVFSHWAESERARLSAIIETTSDLVATSDLHGNVKYLNSAGRDMLGWGHDAQLHRRIADAHPRWAANRILNEALPTAARDGLWRGESALLAPDGQEIPVSQVVIAHKDANGQVEYYSTIMHDITAMKRAQAERLSFEKQVQQAQKLESLGVLAGGIAHDFNNLLVGILGNAEMILTDMDASSGVQRSAQDVRSAAKRASDLCDQLLAYAGERPVAKEVVNVNRLIREMSSLLAATISKKVRIEYAFAESLPAIEADAVQLTQVIMNLITNASDAVGDKPGLIRLETGVERMIDEHAVRSGDVSRIQPEPCVFIRVEDTGCGINETMRQRIFDPFFTTKFHGRGLGLSAVLGIIRAHNGAITVESSPGQGTCFSVYLPALAEQAERETPQAMGAAGYRGSGHVLVVDDEDLVLDVACRMLAHHGFDVLTASDGREAERILREQGRLIRVVILDLTMPVMDGIEVLDRLRAVSTEVPIILSSGYTSQDAISRYGETGFAGFLHKPYEMNELIDAIRSVLA